MKILILAGLLMAPLASLADTRGVYLETAEDERIRIATVTLDADKGYTVEMAEEPFADHFLSMRPFKCLEGPSKHWCHVPYPYEIARNVGNDLIDLEYDFLFIWKGATEYGINMWNGIYYKLEGDAGGTLTGTLHEMDMDLLSAPPAAGELRPLRQKDLHLTDPASHWLPRLVIE